MDLDLKTITLAIDARSYYDAYEVLQEKTNELSRIKSIKIPEHQKRIKVLRASMALTGHNMNLSTPALICLAFSIELHVKLLLHTYDLIAKGHNIRKLLEKLPIEDIDYISNHPDFHPTQQGEGFFDNIDKAANLFIRTRYYFENMDTLHFNTGFCITLAKVIRKRVVERVPYLRLDLGS